MDVCEGKVCIVCKEHFVSLNEVLLKCIIHFSVSFCWYALPNVCMQISHPLAYGVCISLKASATIGSWNSSKTIFQVHTKPLHTQWSPLSDKSTNPLTLYTSTEARNWNMKTYELEFSLPWCTQCTWCTRTIVQSSAHFYKLCCYIMHFFW